MKCNTLNRITSALLFIYILLAAPEYLKAAPAPGSNSQNCRINRTISVSVAEEKNGTRVKVAGNGKTYEYVTKTLVSPPRVLVDIFMVSTPFKTKTVIPSKSRNISSIRLGYHLKSIRVVLDAKGEKIPPFTVSSGRKGVSIFIKSRTEVSPEGRLAERGGQGTQTAPQTERDEDGGKATAGIKQKPDPETTLTRLEVNDWQDDTSVFLEGLSAFKAQDFAVAIERLNHLIKTYPTGRYMERAYFILAKSYGQTYSDSIPAHFREITDHYEEAIRSFPESAYVPGAIAAIGDLCFRMKYHAEALGYYNLVLKKYKDSPVALNAMMQKAKIFHLKGRKKEALSVLELLVSIDTDMHRKTEAEIEISKVLHELNSFRRSLDRLFQLRERNPQYIYQYPEISLYIGYNYQQLGDFVRARKNLFRVYNSCPDRKTNHLILTKIGDTYKDEGLIDDAVKIYRLVRKRYPDTEGARISAIRLAEQQQEGRGGMVAVSGKGIGRDIGKSREIYEDIISNSPDKDVKDPLRQLALLKLAVLHQKGKNFDKCVNALKKLFKEYPQTSLEKEARYTLQKAVESFFTEEMKAERYISIINIYEREKRLFSIVDSPEPFLAVARACLNLNLEDMATEMFVKADPLLQEKEKPPDLLFYLSRNLSENERPAPALVTLDLLINNYPSDKYAGYAYRLKGDILLSQNRYAQAAEMFSSALDYPLTRCERSRLLVDKAGALARCGFSEEAFAAIRGADSLKGACNACFDYIYQEIGDLYLKLGYPEDAAVVFNQAAEIVKEKPGEIAIKFKLAQCYRLLNRRDDSIALYAQISSFNDPFWSNLAKERIEEINFNGEVAKRANWSF